MVKENKITHDVTPITESEVSLLSCFLGDVCAVFAAPERSWHHPEVF